MRVAPSLPAHHTGGDVFNLGAGEITVLILLGIIFLGPNTLPDLVQKIRGSSSRLERADDDTRRQPWTWSDRLLVTGVVLLTSLTITLATVGR
jgi:hypothetical protein